MSQKLWENELRGKKARFIQKRKKIKPTHTEKRQKDSKSSKHFSAISHFGRRAEKKILEYKKIQRADPSSGVVREV